MPIKVIDLFAGCGGLGEGFSAVKNQTNRAYEVCLSIDSDSYACKSLRLRKFFWEFKSAPKSYYDYLRGNISLDQLIAKHPREWARAESKVVQAELGDNSFTDEDLPLLIRKKLGRARNWVLVGGPPCQAYSTAGRAKNRSNKDYRAEDDGRHFLYQQFLKVIAEHAPPVFLMENVEGLTSSTVGQQKIFSKMLEDLTDPAKAIGFEKTHAGEGSEYRLFSVCRPTQFGMFRELVGDPSTYVINSEEFGIPQSRARVFLLGVRLDIKGKPRLLAPAEHRISVKETISDLPRLRSALSSEDNKENWLRGIRDAQRAEWMTQLRKQGREELCERIVSITNRVGCPRSGIGGRFVKGQRKPKYLPSWYHDPRLGGSCNHDSRSHMLSDLHRYLFAATEIQLREDMLPRNRRGRVAALSVRDFPSSLLPNHKNIQETNGRTSVPNKDRFKVQQASAPANTIMSHIAKDGHYYIHYDPTQCRSLTVREAARLQTFPDNYFFEGPRGAAYRQVGNAVPPLLSHQIAKLIEHLLNTQ